MPKNVKGGKGAKRGSKGNSLPKNRELPVVDNTIDQHIAKVESIHGDLRYTCKTLGGIQVMARLRLESKSRRNPNIAIGTYVRINSTKPNERPEIDVVFTPEEVHKLVSLGEITETDKNGNEISDSGFEFTTSSNSESVEIKGEEPIDIDFI